MYTLHLLVKIKIKILKTTNNLQCKERLQLLHGTAIGSELQWHNKIC